MDATTTECMLASEKKLTPPEVVGKFPEQIQVPSKVKYFKLLYLHSQGQPVNKQVLSKAHTKLGINKHSNDPKELYTLINRDQDEKNLKL